MDMPSVVHFEIPADNVERARKFYSGLFGWEIKQMPGMDYWLFTPGGEKPAGGGMMKRQHPQHTITVYFDVASVDEYSAKVKDAGGSIAVPKMAVPGEGYFAVCMDTENNAFGLWEANKEAK
ncbi:MAG: VOC family protein [Nitrospiraceae bacterium]|nr:VOC family protein [Nitrospiraceae bacterium]